MGKRIWIHPTIADMNLVVTSQFAEIVTLAIQSRGFANVSLSGGETPMGVYNLLAQQPFQSSILWDKIHFYWGDERCVSPENPDSNYGQVSKALLNQVPVRAENIHRIYGELTPEDAASAYISELARYAQENQVWPIFDITLLGMGEDGHTASLFPGKIIPEVDTNPAIVVYADYQGRPATRITLTPPVFNTSRNVLFLVTGANKAPMLSRVLEGPQDSADFPIQRIQPIHGSVTWHVDNSAATLIRKGTNNNDFNSYTL